MNDTPLFPLTMPDWMVEAFRPVSFLPPPRFNGVPCEHYRLVKKFQRELEQGGYTEYKSVSFEGETPEELIEWTKGLPTGAKLQSTDWEGGIRASWEEIRPLTPGERLLREEFIESHPIPEGDPDPTYLKFRRSVPFDAPIKAFVEGETCKRGPYWNVTDHPLSEKDEQ